MKSMNNDENSSRDNNGWLGFSLSPHSMNLEADSASDHHHTQTQPPSNSTASTALPTSTFFHTPTLLNYNTGCSLYYGMQGENVSFFSPTLPVMPLKSDGSLCIMQGMLPTATPKLEDFFGGETMGAHHYENHDREAMPLSLDSSCSSMFYQHEPSSQNFTHNPHPCYSSFRESNATTQTKETHVANCNIQLPTTAATAATMAENEISGLKIWASRNCIVGGQALDHKMIDCMGDNSGQTRSIGSIGYGDLQSLSLSMSPSSQSSCVTGSQQISPAPTTEHFAMETRKRMPEKVDNQRQIVHRKSLDTFGQRTSQYRGVTRHRWTGRYEAHLWDNSCKKEGQSRKGRQVYLGGYDTEEKAARAYDLAALKYWGPSTHINFPLENYQQELEDMKNMTRQEYVAHLRRNSSGFSRGASMYRGVTRHHQHGRWQARIGRVAGNKDLYLGTFSTQEEAAEAYDIAAIKFRGINAVTNFNITRYDVERIMASSTLIAGDLARRNKEIPSGDGASNFNHSISISSRDANESRKNDESESDSWKMLLYQSTQQSHNGPIKLLDPNTGTMGNQKDPAISLGQNSLIKVDKMNCVNHQEMNDSAKAGNHIPHASSLVTTLDSSREGSPDRGSLAFPFTMPPSASTLFANATGDANSWIPSVQMRPSVSMSQMPVFAAWADS
ncbi:hypothetical protein Ancab_025862 [Ancistrocladus abbreviatus]